jgi:hypothetical protein
MESLNARLIRWLDEVLKKTSIIDDPDLLNRAKELRASIFDEMIEEQKVRPFPEPWPGMTVIGQTFYGSKRIRWAVGAAWQSSDEQWFFRPTDFAAGPIMWDEQHISMVCSRDGAIIWKRPEVK